MLGDVRIFSQKGVANAMRFSGRAIGMAEPTSLCCACVCVGLSGLLDNNNETDHAAWAWFAGGSAGPALRVLTMERKKGRWPV